MILIITTNSIDLKKHIYLKNTIKVQSIGEIDLTISNSISLKDEVLNFKVKDSKLELFVGLDWIKSNYNISSIIFFDYIHPINNNLLGNHVVIPKIIFCIDDPPLEWGNNPLISKIEINTPQSKKIRNIVHQDNYDFTYGNILSVDNKFITASSIKELSDSNLFDGLNNLIFTANKFANENKIEIYNKTIVKTKYMTNLKYEKLLENLF